MDGHVDADDPSLRGGLGVLHPRGAGRGAEPQLVSGDAWHGRPVELELLGVAGADGECRGRWWRGERNRGEDASERDEGGFHVYPWTAVVRDQTSRWSAGAESVSAVVRERPRLSGWRATPSE